MGRPPRFTDAGALSPGTVKTRKGSTEFYWCPSCDKSQVESKLARSRSSRVKCRHCGRILHPLHEGNEASAESIQVRQCVSCNTILRSTNRNGACSVCFESLSVNSKLRGVAARSPSKCIHIIRPGAIRTYCCLDVKKLLWPVPEATCSTCIRESNKIR